MKRFILSLLAVVVLSGLQAQNAPVAVDDTVVVGLADTVIVNVVQNDYHPDGIPFRITAVAGHPFPDSTISIYLNYDNYWNWSIADTFSFYYQITDINGNVGYGSSANVYVVVDNNPFNYLDTNNVKARILSSSLQFWNHANTGSYLDYDKEIGYLFPKDLKKSPVFSNNLWVSALDENDSLHVTAERYRQFGVDFWAGPVNNLDGEISADVSNAVKWNRVWKLTKEEVIYHKFHYKDAGYQPVEAIATWPAHGDQSLGQAEYIAPFVDTDGDGIYNPMNGDYPLIRGDECIFLVFNDVREHTESKGDPLGLEVQVMAYEFYNPDTLALQNAVFFSYKIFNRSSNTYHKTSFGLFTDLDIGSAWDDYLGCDIQRGLFYGLNGDSIDGNSPEDSITAYPDKIPAQTVMLLGGPLMESDGEDNPSGECNASINGVGFGDGIVDNERYGMTRFVYMTNGGYETTDPADAKEYYQFMNGIWNDGTAMEYGGNGHVAGGAYGPATKFVFPGMSDPCNWGTGGEEPYGPVDWTMENAGTGPNDIRGTVISGDFTFKPGDMQRLDIAYVSAMAEEGKTALETVLGYSDLVRGKYLKNPDDFGYQYLGLEDKSYHSSLMKLDVWPNPAGERFSFTYQGKNKTAVYTLHNLTGKVIASGTVQNKETVVVDMRDVPEGLYIINVTDRNNVYTAKVVKQ